MTDEDFDKVDEDFASEFDFVDTQDKTAATPPTGNGSSNPPPKMSQTIISLLVLVSIIGGGYYAYKSFFGSSKKDDTTANPPATPLPQPVEAPANAIPEPDVSVDHIDFSEPKQEDLSAALPPTKSFSQVQSDLQRSQQQAPVTMPAEIRTALQSISEEMTSNVNNIKQLESTINTLTTTVDQLNKVVNAMDNRVLGLTETVDSLSQDLTNVKKVMVDEDMDLASPGTVKFTNKKQTQSINNASPSYTVHAIIPGRAWLKSSSGQIITVTEGDKIGDYGTVAVIDSNNGIVRTSSGIVLK